MFALFTYQVYTPREIGRGPVDLTIAPGQSLKDIAQQLRLAGVIQEPFFFYLYALKRGIAGELKAGHYRLPGVDSMAHVAMLMAFGKTVSDERTVTIPEGFTVNQVADRMVAAGLPASSLAHFTIDDALKLKFPALADVPNGRSLEGYLFPETYRFNADASVEAIRDRLLAMFTSKVAPLMASHRPMLKSHSLFDIATMASLLEREVKTVADKKLVAGILWKRLAAKVPLQVDATILYGQALDGRVGRGFDASDPTPYNTYSHRGLPPGPISNPGLDSIQAALEPTDSAYWYYLSKFDGTTVFSKTFDEHIKAKQRYLR